MRNLSIRIAGCFLVLTALIWTLGCGPSATNSNVAQNQNANAELANSNTARVASAACSGTLTVKRQNVEDEIKRLIDRDDELKAQYASGAFDFQVVIVDMYLEAHFKGLIGGEDELEDLSEILNNFKEDECLLMVRMASKRAGGGSVPPVPVAGFEWNMCEWPKYPCPNGTCECQRSGNGGANVNANTNTNTNTNANVNSSKVNR